MSSLVKVIASGQYEVPSGDMEQLIPLLQLNADTVAKSDDSKRALVDVITAYMPVLSDRVDRLARQATIAGEISTHMLAQRRDVAAQVEGSTNSNLTSSLNKVLNSYELSDAGQKANWASYTTGSVPLLSQAMQTTDAAFLSIFSDASSYNIRNLRKIEFYNKYAAHLQARQEYISRQITFLLDARNILAQMLKILQS